MKHSNTIHSAAAQNAEEYLAGWQRARAELANFRKRMQAGQQEQQDHYVRALLEPLLPLHDNFRAMTAHVPPDLKDHPWVAGVLHVARQLTDILGEFNVVLLEPTVGSPFDPNLHEAIDHVASDHPSNTVVEVVQVGYQLKGKTLRPAKVKVAI